MKAAPKLIRILLLLIVLAVVAFIFKERIKRMFHNIREAQKKREERRLLEDLGIELSHSSEYWHSLATELYQAVSWSWYNPNCNETATQRALMKVNNDRDYNELAIAFGVKDSYNMETYVQSCLNQSEKNIVNQNWANKGMSKRI